MSSTTSYSGYSCERCVPPVIADVPLTLDVESPPMPRWKRRVVSLAAQLSRCTRPMRRCWPGAMALPGGVTCAASVVGRIAAAKQRAIPRRMVHIRKFSSSFIAACSQKKGRTRPPYAKSSFGGGRGMRVEATGNDAAPSTNAHGTHHRVARCGARAGHGIAIAACLPDIRPGYGDLAQRLGRAPAVAEGRHRGHGSAVIG